MDFHRGFAIAITIMMIGAGTVGLILGILIMWAFGLLGG